MKFSIKNKVRIFLTSIGTKLKVLVLMRAILSIFDFTKAILSIFDFTGVQLFSWHFSNSILDY